MLDFKEGRVTTASLDNLSGLERVGVVYFSLSDVRDEHIPQLKGIGRIQHLSLNNTKVTDECIDALIDLPDLESVATANTLMTFTWFVTPKTGRP